MIVFCPVSVEHSTQIELQDSVMRSDLILWFKSSFMRHIILVFGDIFLGQYVMYSSNLGRHFSSTSFCSVSCKKSNSGFSSSSTFLISVIFSPFIEYNEPPMFIHPIVISFPSFDV